jgi:NAD(P)H-flavin reductase
MILPKPFIVKIVENIKLTSRVRRIVLEFYGKKPIYLAGQFLMFDISDGVKRAYSIASAPENGNRIKLFIDISPNGPASKFFTEVLVNAECVITAPYGLFTLRDTNNDKIFITASTGVAPVRAMLRDYFMNHNRPLNDTNPKFTLYFGVNKVEELFLVEEFRAMEEKYPNFKYIPVVLEPETEWLGERGLVGDPYLRDETNFVDKDIYLCGSPKMVPAVKKQLLAKGVPEGNIYNERY